MIVGFRHRGLKRLYERGDRSRVSPRLVDQAEEILGLRDSAKDPEDMDLPGYRLHRLILKGIGADSPRDSHI